jgi:phosphopantothenoylcysteine decarboxylase/phosphopantothenate--cysteine ligase
MATREKFLAEIEAFLKEANMSATRFGREAVGDPRLVFDLRSTSRAPNARLMDEVAAFMAAHGKPGARESASPDARTVLLIIGGGIAAYKSLDLIRRLRERGHAVRVVLTAAACKFITPLSVGALTGGRVFTELFGRADEHDVGHIRLAREAAIVVVAPATADLMAKMAGGHADDLATAILLATTAPILLAPAMNPRMWANPATVRNVALLKADGVRFVGPNAGEMAEANEAGLGRMAEPTEIAVAAAAILEPRSAGLAGRRVIITSGPTHEPIDPVRYLANRSSGRQGHAIAAAAAAAGAAVTLVSGPVSIPDPAGVNVVRVETAAEMLAAVEAALPADVAVMAAAVGDWRPVRRAVQKIKKRGAPPSLALKENPDILATIGHHRTLRPRLVIGFAAETEDLLANARKKLAAKGADWIVANDVSPAAGVMGGENNTVHVLSAGGVEDWPAMAKTAVAERLIELIAKALEDKA